MGIVIVSDNIESHSKIEGYLVRVGKIDDLLRDKDRTYLEFSYKRNFFKKKTKLSAHLEVIRLNVFAHCFYAFWISLQSELVYVHSVHNLKKAPLVLFLLKKMVLDLHGLVSVEVERRRWLYKLLEKITWRGASNVVCVTEAMASTFSSLYGPREKPTIILPIYTDAIGIFDEDKRTYDLVYSGGTQTWQCIDKVVKTVKSFPQAKVLVLTPDIELFEKLFAEELHRVSIRYCTGTKYFELLATARYGLMLRNESTLNRVACPTKMIEYLHAGIVPVMMYQDLGDFKRLGMRAIELSNFTGPGHLSDVELMQWRTDNRQVIKKLSGIVNEGKRQLLDLVG